MAITQNMETRFRGPYAGMRLPDALATILAPLDMKIIAEDGYRSRRSGTRGIDPNAHVTHWTAGSSKPGARVCQALCKRRALVTFYSPTASREIRVISNGRTGHAGKGNAEVLSEIKKSGPIKERHGASNTWNGGYTNYTGIEIEHSGTGKVHQNSIDVMFGLGAAMCMLFGWQDEPWRHVSHQHIAGSRKVDFNLHENGMTTPYTRPGTPYAAGTLVNFADKTAEYMARLGSTPVPAKPIPAELDPNVKMPYIYLRDPMMFGSQIKYAQELLNKAGFDAGPADGWFGQKSHNAVVSLQVAWLGQSKVNPASAGKLGKSTWKRLLQVAGA